MFQPDDRSDRQESHERAQAEFCTTQRNRKRLIFPGFGLIVALVAVVCFADDLRSTDSASTDSATTDSGSGDSAAVDAATIDSAAAASAGESGTGSPVALLPSSSSDAQSVSKAAERAIPAQVRQLLGRLKSGDRFLRNTKRYAATFTQQVHKDGRLLDPETIDIKVQHEPFAVFMQWVEDGQQALYVQGQHDNKLLVHPTRGFGRLRRVWILDPDSGLAMRGARRPVTELGLLNMVELLLGFHREHILCSNCAAHKSESKEAGTTRYTLTFDGPHENPYYAKTVLWLCDERHIPLRIENYSWTDDNQVGPLLESYRYADICVDECVVGADFDRENEAYSF